MPPFFDRIAQLERDHARFAIATVVARRSPVSSHLGDRALVFDDGRMEGFVGGSCSRDLVRREALAAIRTRQPLLLQIRPGGPAENGAADGGIDAADGGHSASAAGTATERVVVPMSCSSEGAVDVYIEPRVPLRRLIVAGFTPVADALAHAAAALEYDVIRVVAPDERRDLGPASGARVVPLAELPDFLARLDASGRRELVAVVASQGHYDEIALEALLADDLAFVGLLASRRRAVTVMGVLAQQGVPPGRLAAIRNPVGLDIGARSPGEVAVSILAEIIAAASARDAAVPDEDAATPAAGVGTAATAVDPVCGMAVELATALHTLEHDGRPYAFCCAGCRAAFAAEPASFLVAAES